MDKEKTKKRWTEYCSNLYKNPEEVNRKLLDDLHNITPAPKEDENESILYEEVEEAIRYLKKNKSPGVDEIKRRDDTGRGEYTHERNSFSV